MLREDLVSSAVSFLQDPSVAASALDKRIAFLQSKNLTQEEIDVSLSRAGDLSQASNTPTAPSSAPPSQYGYENQPPTRQPQGYGYGYGPYQGGPWSQGQPEPPRRDWRDWFIMATVTSGVGYGLYTVAKRYVLPLISPPTPPQLEADKASIDASFSRAFALIDQLTTDTADLKEKETQRTEKLDATLKDVDAVIEDLKAANTRREVESRIIADQINGLKEQVPKALEGWKAKGDAKLEELSQEMQSLKKLLENRVGRSGGTSTPTGRGHPPSGSNNNGNDPTNSNTQSSTSTSTNKQPTSSQPNPDTTAPAPGSTTLNPTTQIPSSSTPRTFEPRDRKAIPAWQRAATEKGSTGTSTSSGGSGSSESGKAEAGA